MRFWMTVPLTCVALLATATAPGLAAPVPTESSSVRAMPLPSAPTAARAATPVKSVLVISVDGLSTKVLTQLGRKRTPHLHRLMRQGSSTLNARTAVELTDTLPNHTGMVTGRRIEAAAGGHGVTWNDDRKSPRTVHEAADESVGSLFKQVDAAGGRTALFAGKTKFSLWNRSWGQSIDRVKIRDDKSPRLAPALRKDRRLAADVRTDLRKQRRALRFWHLATPDRAGHRTGFMKPRYRKSIRQADAMIGSVLRVINRTPRLRKSTAVILTSDHGATLGRKHDDPSRLGNQRVLFVVKGPEIARGADLYALNQATRANPGRRQPAYDATLPPVRNGEAANLALDLLGIEAVPGSEFNLAQDLSLVRP